MRQHSNWQLALAWWACSCPLSAAGDDGAYRLRLEAASTRSDLPGLSLILTSAAIHGGGLWLRAGYRHTLEAPRFGKIAAPSGTVRLEGLATPLDAIEVDARLQQPVLEDGLREGMSRMGALHFSLDANAGGDWLERELTLVFPPFPALNFRLEKSMRFEPANLDDLQDAEHVMPMRPVEESLALIGMRVTALTVGEGRITFAMESVNESRFPMGWSGGLSLRSVRLRTGEGEPLEPVTVSGGLAEGLGPAGDAWQPGARNPGTIGFRLPHPHAAERLALLMPGYAPLELLLDEQEKTWTTTRDEAATPMTPAQEIERRYASLTAFWTEQGKRLQQRDQEGFLRRFGAGAARDGMGRALAGLVRVPMSWVEFIVPPKQPLAGNDLEVKNLLVEMRFLLAGLPRENEFLARWRCDLRRETVDKDWQITSRRVEGREAFWERGFTEMISTEHFLVFYQLSAEDGVRRARATADQLATARQRLLKTGLPVSQRHAAFVIPGKDDFRALTGRDPGTFTGAASAAYALRDGELRVMNQALYVNDSHFSSLQRRWGRQDRTQTIQHELVHLALAPVTRPWTPAWLVEGVATFKAGQLDAASRDNLRRRLPGGRVLAHLSTLRTLGESGESEEEIWAQYHYSAAAVQWIERQFGEQTLLKLYTAYSQARPHQWHSSTQGVALLPGGQEPDEMRKTRLEIADGVLAEVLGGWRLDQVDAATRRDLQR